MKYLIPLLFISLAITSCAEEEEPQNQDQKESPFREINPINYL